METEDILFDLKQAINAALYHALQNNDERYNVTDQIAELIEKLIDAKLAERTTQ